MTVKKSLLVCVASFVAKEGKADELLKEMSAMMPLTRREDGCVRYELNQSIDDPNRLTMIEKFASDEAFEVHRQADYVGRLFSDVIPVLVESFRVETFREIAP